MKAGNTDAGIRSKCGDVGIILVAGMHRSGTSLCAAILNFLGVDLSERLLPANASNPKGYWEHVDSYLTNDGLLGALGSHWSDPRSLPEGWEATAHASAARERLLSFLKRDFHGSLLGLKDPRLCRLLPLWLDICGTLGLSPTVLHPLRHPLAVARSLERRDQLRPRTGLILWLRHLIDAEDASRRVPRSFIAYDHVLADWQGEFARVGKELGINWPVKPATAAPRVEEFISPELRHNVEVNPRSEFEMLCVEIYRACLELRNGQVLDAGLVERARTELDDIDQIGALSATAETHKLSSRLEAAITEKQNLGAENRRLKAEASELEHNLATRERDNDGLREQVQTLATNLNSTTAEIHNLEAENRKLEAELDSRESRLITITGELDASFIERLRLANDLNRIVTDKWWKRTAPFRRASNSIRKRRGKPKKYWPKFIDPATDTLRATNDNSAVTRNRAVTKLGTTAAGVYAAHAAATAPGPHFEDFHPIPEGSRKSDVKLLAYYLTQFHAIPENDANWGTGFTEWRNIVRGEPRFVGHIQPKVPRDLGFYDLLESDVHRRQIEMARAAGLHGFCYYYYWFDGRRVLEQPLERLLKDPTLDFPFCLMWANENWTRTWDGAESDVLLRQSYRREDDVPFIDDLARHFHDPRYIAIDGRPLFFIYRPGHIPGGKKMIARWRMLFRERHNIEPLIYMAQSFGDLDPRTYGLDGSIEFPPHKVLNTAEDINHKLPMLDPRFSGRIVSYDDVVDIATADPAPNYPLIRTVTPNWDNDARRPGRSTILQGSTPQKFGRWLRWAIDYARNHPTHGTSFVCVNAWNEWAEGAYLEPDVHYGAAYLNEVARALSSPADSQAIIGTSGRMKVLLVGHDAMRFGAQHLLLQLGRMLARRFGLEVNFLLACGGELLDEYREVGKVEIIDADADLLGVHLSRLRAKGYTRAITNTAVTGRFVPKLRDAGFEVISLIHEMADLIRSYDLGDDVRAIAQHSGRVIFPATIVRDSFLSGSGPLKGESEILPQGLYRDSLLTSYMERLAARLERGIPADAQLVINVGYADHRKGIDRFVETALLLCKARQDTMFFWIGATTTEEAQRAMRTVEAANMSDRICFPGYDADVDSWYAAADVFFLTSREDPFPSVVLEAMALGLPVVGYEGTGGCDDLIRAHGNLVLTDDPSAACVAISECLDAPQAQRHQAAVYRRAEIATKYRFDTYCFDLLQRFCPSLPTVSVIVPNYNYAAYIGDRLRTIFAQSHPVFEVIVLDDASTDDSVDQIRTIAATEHRDIQLHVAEINSGSAFIQWRNGLARARGEFIWIAEADDLADPQFLERVLKRMQESGAALGFSDSWQIDEDGIRIGDSYKSYINAIGGTPFDESFDMPGSDFLARFLAVKNVILNVSGVIFRRDALESAVESLGAELDEFSVAGDWRLYAAICASGGSVAYEAEPLNGHRRHQNSVTHSLNAQQHLGEIQRVQDIAAGLVSIDEATREAQETHLAEAKKVLLGSHARTEAGETGSCAAARGMEVQNG